MVTDPMVTTEKMLASGEPELETLALADLEETGEEEVDLKAASLKVEAGLGELAGYGPEGAGGGGGGGGGGTGPLPNFVVYVAREYVWGPGDSHAGTDELLVQFDTNRWAWWVLQDAGG